MMHGKSWKEEIWKGKTEGEQGVSGKIGKCGNRISFQARRGERSTTDWQIKMA